MAPPVRKLARAGGRHHYPYRYRNHHHHRHRHRHRHRLLTVPVTVMVTVTFTVTIIISVAVTVAVAVTATLTVTVMGRLPLSSPVLGHRVLCIQRCWHQAAILWRISLTQFGFQIDVSCSGHTEQSA